MKFVSITPQYYLPPEYVHPYDPYPWWLGMSLLRSLKYLPGVELVGRAHVKVALDLETHFSYGIREIASPSWFLEQFLRSQDYSNPLLRCIRKGLKWFLKNLNSSVNLFK